MRSARLPVQRTAMAIVAEMYDSYRLERYMVRKTVDGPLKFEPVAHRIDGDPSHASVERHGG